MLYKLDVTKPTLEPCEFNDMSGIGHTEKDLENLLANNLLENLFEQSFLMPIFQERRMQPEPDLVALDEQGNLVIFELKRGEVTTEAVSQIMRYVQNFGLFSYEKLDEYFQKYNSKQQYYGARISLSQAHQNTFDLATPLSEDAFNKQQHLCLIGNSIDAETIKLVDFWRNKGISIDFIPYRIYKIAHEIYVEFFAKPYDVHFPPNKSGIIVDTNQAWLPEAAEDMIITDRAICSGKNTCDNIDKIKGGNYVFLYHKGVGIITCGKVNKNAKVRDDYKPSYYPNDITKTIEVKWDIKPTINGKTATGPTLCASEIKRLLPRIKPGYRFRGTTKLYLSKKEAEIIAAELEKKTPIQYSIK